MVWSPPRTSRPTPRDRAVAPGEIPGVRDVGVHIADALHHGLPIALASLKSKDMRRKANDLRDGAARTSRPNEARLREDHNAARPSPPATRRANSLRHLGDEVKNLWDAGCACKAGFQLREVSA
jgi:hypothetical protein